MAISDFTWQPSDGERYDAAFNVLPPVRWSRHTGLFLLGETFDHRGENGRARFVPHLKRGSLFFVGSRPITLAEFDSLEHDARGPTPADGVAHVP